jgi:cysteine desulfurase
MTHETIYLDNNATTRVAQEVFEAMKPYFSDRYGNPSSIHRFGGLVSRAVTAAREQVAAFLGAHPEEIYFTSCGSESDNMAIRGFCEMHGKTSRYITSTVEHPAVRNMCFYLRDQGYSLIEIPVDENGNLDIDALRESDIDSNTLCTFMWANNETGVLFPVERLAEIAKQRGALFHTDAVQAAGKIPITIGETAIDMLSISGHKLHAPKGIGVIYIRKGLKIPPLFHGGHQEDGMRAGTENVPYIIGLGKACELAGNYLDEERGRVAACRDRLETALLQRCAGAKLNGDKGNRLPNTTNISFENIEGEAILLLLDEHGIAASSGSACTTGSLEPSHVMRAMGIPYTYAHSSIRFSLSRYTTEQQIDTVIDVMPPIIERLRSLSPFVK